jgi:hypothetical protein
MRGVVRTGRWARLSTGRETNLLSSHAGRSDASDGRQNTQQATPTVGTDMENQPARRTQNTTLSRYERPSARISFTVSVRTAITVPKMARPTTKRVSKSHQREARR